MSSGLGDSPGRAPGTHPLRRTEALTGGPVGFRKWLERLGPTFVKLGQYLALRPDLISQEYADELMLLFDRVPPFSWEAARAIISTELGSPEELFLSIDHTPVAAGSIAQVHVARLHDGTEVAVKIQRPDIGQRVARDLSRARLLARVLELSRISLVITPKQVVDEVSEWMLQQLDFENELANLQVLRQLAADSAIQMIPRAYPGLSSRRVLTMEYIQGVPLSQLVRPGDTPSVDHTWGGPPGVENGYAVADVDRERLAANLITATLHQIFKYQFFHADLHPGNLYAMRGEVIGYADFGICDSWDGVMRGRLLRYLAAIYSAEVEQMYRALSEILIASDDTDMAAFRADFYAESRRWTSRMRTSGENRASPTQHDRSPIAQWMIAVMGIIRKHHLRVPPMIVSIYRALLVAETVATKLGSSADLRTVGQKFFEQLQVEEVMRLVERRSLEPVMLSYATLLRDSPGHVNQLLTELAEGSFSLSVSTFEPPRVARANNRRVRVIVNSVLSVGVAILLSSPTLPVILGLQLAAPLAALLVVLYVWIFADLRRLR